jgi:hypothetical protein
MDPYMDECTRCIHGFGQSFFTLLANCMRVTYDNYSTTWINETLISNFFANFKTNILDFCATTQLLATIIIIITLT